MHLRKESSVAYGVGGCPLSWPKQLERSELPLPTPMKVIVTLRILPSFSKS